MRNAWIVLLLLMLAGCGAKLPKLPEIDFSPFPPAVRQAVEKAHSDAEFTPGDAQRTGDLARVLHGHGFYDAAIIYYRHARELAPDNATYAHLLGVALASRGKHPEATEAFNKSLALRGADAPPTKFALAASLLANGSPVEAAALYRSLGDHPVARYGLSRTLKGAAQLDELQAAVAWEPRYGDAWKALAEAYRVKGDTEKAAEADRAYQRYLGQEPSTGDGELTQVHELNQTPAGLSERARRAEAESRLLDAAKLYQQMAANDPADDTAWAKLTAVYIRLKDHAAAAKAHEEGRQRKPESPALASVYGLLLSNTQRRAEAKPYFEKAVAADANQAEAWYQLGLFAETEGASQKALDCWARAVFADPAHREARYQAALVLTKYKKTAEAREQLELLAKGPEDELTNRARQSLTLVR
jgi:tetratricopeptide (TPR) repeat protein